MTISVLCESPRRSPSSGEVCLEVCSRQCSLCLHLFFSTVNLGFEISSGRFEILNSLACVAEQQRHLTVNQADLTVLRGCESYHMHQKFLGRRLTCKPSDSKPEILGSNPGVPANSKQSHWKGSLTGKAVVLKTTALVACRFKSCPFRHSPGRRRLMVWQRFAKSPRIACAGSTPAASANV